MMEYTNSKPMGSKAGEAVKSIIDTLSGQGFRIDCNQSTLVQLTGPGMNHSSQSPLVGASKVVVRNGGGQVTIEAEFNGVRRMMRTLGVLIVALGDGVSDFVRLHHSYQELRSVGPIRRTRFALGAVADSSSLDELAIQTADGEGLRQPAPELGKSINRLPEIFNPIFWPDTF
jgi:hypothetical protein